MKMLKKCLLAVLPLVVLLAPAGSAQVETRFIVPSSNGDESYGRSVSVDGDTALIGDPSHSGAAQAAGAAHVYVHDGTAWNLQDTLIASDAAPLDQLGYRTDLSGDTAVITALMAEGAYVFVRSGSTWSEQAWLLGSDVTPDDYFGESLSIDGDTVVVGAGWADHVGENAGAAYVFVRNGTTWTQQAKLTALDAAERDFFGYKVDVSGDTIIVSSDYDDDACPSDPECNSGSAYIFVRNGSAWTQQAKLTAADAQYRHEFSWSVAVSGDRALVGTFRDDHACPSDPSCDAGAAYVFSRTGTTWSQEAKLIASDAAAGDNFGWAASLTGARALIAATGTDDFGLSSGSAYLFARTGTRWFQQAKLLPSDGYPGDQFGRSLSLSGDLAMIGCPYYDYPQPDSGAAFIYGLAPIDATTYCSGKTSSAACIPFVSVLGTPSTSGSMPFWIRAHSALAGEYGLLLYGFEAGDLDFHGGKLCIKSPTTRLWPVRFAKTIGPAACNAFLHRNFNNRIQSQNDPALTAGQTVYVQWFQRDPLDPTGFGDTLSNAVEFTIAP